MAKLLGTERNGTRVDRYWLHTGDDGNDRITVETVEDVEPILDMNTFEMNNPVKDIPGIGRKVASIPATVIEELCRLKKISFRELMAAKTDRAISLWNQLLNDRDLCRLRTAPGRVDMAAKR